MGDAAHKALDQSLLSLPRRKHIKVISQAALLEFKIGSVERARSMFEGILRNYPKRTDLWSVYLDQVPPAPEWFISALNLVNQSKGALMHFHGMQDCDNHHRPCLPPPQMIQQEQTTVNLVNRIISEPILEECIY